jgi:hypothetical protein
MEISNLAMQFYAYWDQARGSDLTPDYKSIRLEEIGSLCTSVFMADWVEEDVASIAYCGNEVALSVGLNMVGLNLLDFAHPKLGATSTSFLRSICSNPCGAKTVLTLRGQGDTPREFEFFYLPLSRDGQLTRIIGTMKSLKFDFEIEGIIGAVQALSYRRPAFIDIGAGTPKTQGSLNGIEVGTIDDFTCLDTENGKADANAALSR